MRNSKIVSRGVMAVMFFAALIAGSAPARASESEVDRLLTILVQKHLLTKEEAASVRAEVEKDKESAPAAYSKPAQQSASATQSAAQTETATDLRERAQSGEAKLPFKISGYGQAQWASLPGSNSTFRLRRGRVSVDGDVGKLATYKIQVETLNSPSLLDAYLTLNVLPFAKVTVGQFKVPFSQENLRSSANLLTVERSQVVNSLVPSRDIGANGRDIGADVAGTFSFSESAGVDYAIGIFNGAGIDGKDNNKRKDFGGRLAVRPFSGLSFAGDYYHGNSGITEVPRDRQGVELAYTYHPLTLLGEYIWGSDGALRKQGWYGLGAWQFSKQWQGVFRVDAYDANHVQPGNTVTDYLGGFNWYFARNLKFQLNYGLEDKKDNLKSLFLSQIQFKF